LRVFEADFLFSNIINIMIMTINKSRDVQIGRLICPPLIVYYDKEQEVVLNISEKSQLPTVPKKSVYRSKPNALGNSIYSINIKGCRGLHMNSTIWIHHLMIR